MIRPHNLWSLKSPFYESNEESISEHIKYFREILYTKMESIKSFKSNSDYQISFWVWIETDNSGVGFQLDEMEIKFINSISNEIRFSVLTNQLYE